MAGRFQEFFTIGKVETSNSVERRYGCHKLLSNWLFAKEYYGHVILNGIVWETCLKLLIKQCFSSIKTFEEKTYKISAITSKRIVIFKQNTSKFINRQWFWKIKHVKNQKFKFTKLNNSLKFELLLNSWQTNVRRQTNLVD
jgi:hypothetical protein